MDGKTKQVIDSVIPAGAVEIREPGSTENNAIYHSGEEIFKFFIAADSRQRWQREIDATELFKRNNMPVAEIYERKELSNNIYLLVKQYIPGLNLRALRNDVVCREAEYAFRKLGKLIRHIHDIPLTDELKQRFTSDGLPGHESLEDVLIGLKKLQSIYPSQSESFKEIERQAPELSAHNKEMGLAFGDLWPNNFIYHNSKIYVVDAETVAVAQNHRELDIGRIKSWFTRATGLAEDPSHDSSRPYETIPSIGEFGKGYESDVREFKALLQRSKLFEISRHVAPHNINNQAFADFVLNTFFQIPYGKIPNTPGRAIPLEPLIEKNICCISDITLDRAFLNGDHEEIDWHYVFPLSAEEGSSNFALYDRLNLELKGLRIEKVPGRLRYLSDNSLTIPLLLKLQDGYKMHEKINSDIKALIRLAQESKPALGLELIAPKIFELYCVPKAS